MVAVVVVVSDGDDGGSGDSCDDGDNACNDVSYGGEDNVDYDDGARLKIRVIIRISRIFFLHNNHDHGDISNRHRAMIATKIVMLMTIRINVIATKQPP